MSEHEPLRLVTPTEVVSRNRTQFTAESVLTDSKGIELGRGIGIFVRSKTPLQATEGYAFP